MAGYSLLPPMAVGGAQFAPPAAPSGGILGSRFPRLRQFGQQVGQFRNAYRNNPDEYPILNALYENKNALLGFGMSDGGWGGSLQGLAWGKGQDQEGRDRREAALQQQEQEAAVREALALTGMPPEQIERIMAISPEAAGTAAVNSIIPQPGGEAIETKVLRGPDGEPHTYGWNQRTGRYDIDMGVAATAEDGTDIYLPGSPDFGPVGAGMARVPDPESPTGFRLVPEPGGQPEADRLAEEQRRQNQLATFLSDSNNVIRTVDEALDLATGGNVGFWGGVLGQFELGTPQYNLNQKLGTIATNLGINEINTMRANSPTGGAVGQVTVQEWARFERATQSLRQGQDETTLRSNLYEVKASLLDAIHGSNNWFYDDQGQVVLRLPDGTTQPWSYQRPADQTPPELRAPAPATPAPEAPAAAGPAPGTVIPHGQPIPPGATVTYTPQGWVVQ